MGVPRRTALRGVGRKPRRLGVTPAAVAVGALAGAWFGHGVEYLRVYGAGEFPTVASRSVHTYVGPVGLLLGVLALVGAGITLRTARLLEERLRGLMFRLAAGTDASPDGRLDRCRDGRPLSKASLVAVVWAVQLVVYLVQENAEAHVMGLRSPGLGALTGVHWAAPLVHLAVATMVGAVVWLLRRPVAHAARRVRSVMAAMDRRARRAADDVPRVIPARTWTPEQRWGVSLWERPPPAVATV